MLVFAYVLFGGPYEGSLGSGFSVTSWVEGFGALVGSLTSGFKVSLRLRV